MQNLRKSQRGVDQSSQPNSEKNEDPFMEC